MRTVTSPSIRSFSSKSARPTDCPSSVLRMRIALNVAIPRPSAASTRSPLSTPRDFVTRAGRQCKGLTVQRVETRCLGRPRRHADDRLLHDRQVDQRRGHAEEDGEPPYEVVGTRGFEQDAAEQHAEEAADLMAEEGKAEQHGEPAGAEHQGNET